jgi:hypothetical protein
MSLESQFKQRIESAGAIFVRFDRGSVVFRAAPDTPELSLYAFCCDHENIFLALKSQREKMLVDHWESLV